MIHWGFVTRSPCGFIFTLTKLLVFIVLLVVEKGPFCPGQFFNQSCSLKLLLFLKWGNYFFICLPVFSLPGGHTNVEEGFGSGK